MYIQRPCLSRRDFLTAAASGASLLIPSWISVLAADVDPRVADVLAQTIGIDMHNHVYPAGTEPHPHFGPPPASQGATQGGPPPQQNEQSGPALLLADELKRSGLTAVCASYVLDFARNDKPGDAIDNLLRWFTAIDTQLAAGHIRRALTLADLQSAHDHGTPAIIQTVEGSMFIEGRLDRIEKVYRRGLRHLQLLHMRDDLVAPLGDVNTEPAHLGGLTAFGAQVIKECNRLGILVDMAHAGHKTLMDALKATSQPFIVSHTNLDTWTGKDLKLAQMMKPHLISKEDARAVADVGGIVGVWTHLAPTLPEFIQSIRAMVDAIGVDHVGIGTDTDLLSARLTAGTNYAYPDMSTGFFPAVVAEMLRQGFTPTEISKIGGGNYCRVFGHATERAGKASGNA